MASRNRASSNRLSRDLQKMKKDIDRLLHKELPEETESKLGEIVTESFRQEKYIDVKGRKWKTRKGERKVKQKNRKNILVSEGDLFASPQTFSKRGAAGVRIADDGKKNGVLTYGPVHNEGKRAGKGKGFKMPKRQFMPIPGGAPNRKVMKHLHKFLDRRGRKIFK